MRNMKISEIQNNISAVYYDVAPKGEGVQLDLSNALQLARPACDALLMLRYDYVPAILNSMSYEEFKRDVEPLYSSTDGLARWAKDNGYSLIVEGPANAPTGAYILS